MRKAIEQESLDPVLDPSFEKCNQVREDRILIMRALRRIGLVVKGNQSNIHQAVYQNGHGPETVPVTPWVTYYGSNPVETLLIPDSLEVQESLIKGQRQRDLLGKRMTDWVKSLD